MCVANEDPPFDRHACQAREMPSPNPNGALTVSTVNRQRNRCVRDWTSSSSLSTSSGLTMGGMAGACVSSVGVGALGRSGGSAPGSSAPLIATSSSFTSPPPIPSLLPIEPYPVGGVVVGNCGSKSSRSPLRSSALDDDDQSGRKTSHHHQTSQHYDNVVEIAASSGCGSLARARLSSDE